MGTNGNNSHNGSEVPKNGEEAEAKDNNSKAEDQPKNGELENGVKSNEESTDLSSQPQSLRSRLHPNPRTPKLSLHPQPIPLLKLQSEKWKKIERKMTFTSSTFSRKTHEKKGSSESTQTILQTPKTILAKHEK